MTNANPQLTPTGWARLVQGSVDMRDTLVGISLALRDHQLTLDTQKRQEAGFQVRQIIGRVKVLESRNGSGRC